MATMILPLTLPPPTSYSWLVSYLSAWAGLSPLDLHQEVAQLESLLLAVDSQFFGCPRLLKMEDPFTMENYEESERILENKIEEARRKEELEAKVVAAKRVLNAKDGRRKWLALDQEERLWWSYKRCQERERCWRCDACWSSCGSCPGCDGGRSCEERGECDGRGWRPETPSEARRCGGCEDCVGEDCGVCWRCNDPTNPRPCRLRRHCSVMDCGVCGQCRRKERWGGAEVVRRETKKRGCEVRGRRLRSGERGYGRPSPRRYSGVKYEEVKRKDMVEEREMVAEVIVLGRPWDESTWESLGMPERYKSLELWQRLWRRSWRMARNEGGVHYVCQLCFKLTSWRIGNKGCISAWGGGEVEGSWGVTKDDVRDMRGRHVKHMVEHEEERGEVVVSSSEGTEEEGRQEVTVPGEEVTSRKRKWSRIQGNCEEEEVSKVKRVENEHQQVFERQAYASFPCDHCGETFSKASLKAHKEKICQYCDKIFGSKMELLDHVQGVHGVHNKVSLSDEEEAEVVENGDDALEMEA